MRSYRPADHVTYRRLDDEMVLVNLRTNRIFTLNASGTRIWELICSGSTHEAVVSAVQDEFDAPAAAM